MKCDEGKPDCHNCTKAGRKCEGYDKVAANQARRLVPPSDNTSLDVVLRGRDVTLPGTSVERRHLDFFQQRTAPDFSGNFNSEFWSRLVLQVSHSEPAVRHAVVALGSLHESLDSGGQELTTRRASVLGHGTPLQQYDQAIAALRGRMQSQDESDILEIALICCVLFHSFETLHGDHDEALLHLQNGLKMLQEWKTKRAEASPPTGPSSVQYELSQVLSRINVQTRWLFDPELPPLHNLTETVFSKTIPERFTDLNQARDFLVAMYNDGFSYYQNMVEQVRSGASVAISGCWHTLAEFGGLDAYLIQWIGAFDRFIERSASTMTSQELKGTLLLRIHYICGFIVLHKTTQPGQCAYDTYNDHFEQIISLASSLLGASNSADSASNKPAFSLDFGIITPLFYTAVNCRDPSIRRRAVSLLSSPRHEGAWSAVDAARVGSIAIEAEEEGLGEIQNSRSVPETSRLCEIYANAAEGNRIRLSCVFSGSIPPQEPAVKEFWLEGCV